MASVSPTLKIPATIYSYKSGKHVATCGVLSCEGATAKQARDSLADDLFEIMCNPIKLLQLAVESCKLNPDKAPRKEVDVALAELGYRRPPTKVRVVTAEPVDEVAQAARIVGKDEVRAGMLIVFERQGGHPFPSFELGIVRSRTPNFRDAKPMLWVDMPQSLRNLDRWTDPDENDWCCGTWWNHEHDVGEVHVLAEDVPLGTSGAEIRALAERAGWPHEFASRTAQLGALVHAVTGEHYDPAVPAAGEQVQRTVGLVRHVLRQRGGLTQIVDGQWRPGERVDLGEQTRLQNACASALWKQRHEDTEKVKQ